ncbi:MAG TPA: HIT domain-containing protein [Pyrinomonadaceae bacterium]|nr:HIT domain-containing protein [Pyrinomonadaceae bacterium]
MDRLFTPWRYDYIKGTSGEKTGHGGACVFCGLAALGDDERAFILHRARHNFVVLNVYPYTSGHLMVVPFEHTADFAGLPKETSDEMTDLAKRAQAALLEVYRPHGFNLGMNLGKAAGAGVSDHLHLHVLPRWGGDTNFMTTVAESRVLPEDLRATYERLRGGFQPSGR